MGMEQIRGSLVWASLVCFTSLALGCGSGSAGSRGRDAPDTDDAGPRYYDAGAFVEQGPVPSATCPLSFADTTCNSCFASHCTQACELCGGDQECNAVLVCLNLCATSDCEYQCESRGLPGSSLALLTHVLWDPNGCLYESCRAQCTTPGRTGDACVVGADCASGQCTASDGQEGWCTRSCATDAQCETDSNGAATWCAAGQCSPGCATDADCSSFGCTGNQATCEETSAVNGGEVQVCKC